MMRFLIYEYPTKFAVIGIKLSHAVLPGVCAPGAIYYGKFGEKEHLDLK
jgi:hypothetical protein